MRGLRPSFMLTGSMRGRLLVGSESADRAVKCRLAIVLLMPFLAPSPHKVCRRCPRPAGGGLRAAGTASLLPKSRSLSSLSRRPEVRLLQAEAAERAGAAAPVVEG